MRNQVHVRAALRQVRGQRVIGTVHPTRAHELRADQEVWLHAPLLPRADAPCNAPARSQNCSPTGAVKGMKLKIRAQVPVPIAQIAAEFSGSASSRRLCSI